MKLKVSLKSSQSQTLYRASPPPLPTIHVLYSPAQNAVHKEEQTTITDDQQRPITVNDDQQRSTEEGKFCADPLPSSARRSLKVVES